MTVSDPRSIHGVHFTTCGVRRQPTRQPIKTHFLSLLRETEDGDYQSRSPTTITKAKNAKYV